MGDVGRFHLGLQKGELGMQVSSRSWHMRLTRKIYGDGYRPTNLCKHFVAVMAVIPLSLFIIYGFFIYGTRVMRAWNGEDNIHPWWVRANKEPKPKKHREPNIFIEWVKAKKNRVCPLIEVVEIGEE